MRSGPSAFSLIEAMVSVAIAGIIAAIAVTSLLPVLRRAELGGASDSVIGFLSRARMHAFTDRRCTQVLMLDKLPAVQQQLVLRELNSFDCDGTSAGHAQTMESAPLIDATQPLWIEIDRLVLDTERVATSFISHPATLTNAEGASCPAEASNCRELRFRPNGRIWSPDTDLTNDDVIVQVRHQSTNEEKTLLIAGNGVFQLLVGGY